MTGLRTPKGFVAGAKLADKLFERKLVEVGFEPGYPVASLMSFDDLWAIHALSRTENDNRGQPKVPLMLLGVRLPDGSQSGDMRPIPMRVREVRWIWSITGRFRPYWYIYGYLESAKEEAWYLNRKVVNMYFIRVFVPAGCNERSEGYVQFIPWGINQFEPESDDLRWASYPSKIPPLVEIPNY